MDVLRLAKAMTYKAAAAGLPLGGGKGLVVADPRTDKTEAMFRSYGRFVDSMGGRYITTEDVGATAREMEWISRETTHVVGLPESMGGSGNPAVVTGYGLYHAMRACAEAVWGSDSLEGRTVAMQGFGNVANSIANYLKEAGARIIVADIFEGPRKKAAEMGVEVVAPEDIYGVEADVFAPCALGGVLNVDTIPRLRAPIVCGAANNQLREPEDAERLKERGIVYAPDYIVNAGGVINVYFEHIEPYDREKALAKAAEIHDTTARVLKRSREEGITTVQAADAIAEQRIEKAKRG
jgi:leucine dehydrogenase